MLPSNISAAMATVSESVGCGWIVSPISDASAPISIASATSATSSPAFGADDAAADDAVGRIIEQQLGHALVAPERQRASAGGPGEAALVVFHALGLCLVLGQPDPGHFRIGVGDRGDHFGVEEAVSARRRLGRHLALRATALWASIGWPTTSPMAKICGTLVRICLSTGM